MKALQLTESKANPLQFVELPKPEPKMGEVLIQLKASALNRRDYWISKGKYPKIQPNVTLGSDGCGIVVETGDNVSQEFLNQEVVINPNINWGDNPVVQSSKYHILGMPTNGTFAEFITVPADRIFLKPKHLSSEQASALPLAGLTAFRSIFTHGEIKKESTVLISGVGGGVAQFAFLFAKAVDSQVFVTSGNNEKIQKILDAGATGAINYKIENWETELAQTSKGFDIVIDSAGGEGFSNFIRMMKPAGRIVFYGATKGVPPNLDLHRAFFRQIRIQGSSMGNDLEFEQMLQFIENHKIEPFVDSVTPFENIHSAFDRMAKNEQFGKLVVKF